MPASSPPLSPALARSLRALGARLRDRRKRLRLSAVATAEAAGLSRVTLYRVEKGEPSVAMGGYLNVASALGLAFELIEPGSVSAKAAPLPRAIQLSRYPQLKKLAWQLRGRATLTPEEALELYERNWRHLEQEALTEKERGLIEQLARAQGRERLLV